MAKQKKSQCAPWMGTCILQEISRAQRLYAVYSFLQNQLDVRWFWPGDDGEFLPALKQWNLNNVNYKFRPVFRFREMTPCVTAAHVPTEIWMARNFLNCGSRTLSIRDKAGYYKYDLGHFVGVYQGLFAERPELFALVDGKRIPEGFVGCWSNPEFTQYAVNQDCRNRQKGKSGLDQCLSGRHPGTLRMPGMHEES